MEINTDFLIRFLNNIAALFGDGCEIVLHDFTKDYDSTIIHIINGHLSGRKVGDCPSSFFFEHLVDGEIKMDDKPVYFNTTQKGKMLKSSTTFLRNKHNKIIKDIRGMGLMLGMELAVPASHIVTEALKNKLILISAGSTIIRFVPPLVIEKEHIDTMYNILDGIFNKAYYVYKKLNN